LFVVPSTPRPVRYVALSPEFAEILAVGVPREVDPTLMKANFDDSVEIAPSVKSVVRFP